MKDGRLLCTVCLKWISAVFRFRTTCSIQFEWLLKQKRIRNVRVIPAEVYKKIMEESAAVANYTNEIMASRFSEVMWLIEQIMWKSLDKRVADFLLKEATIEQTERLQITHETIANHLGTHREVVTRMLRYFQGEGMVKFSSRGVIEILDYERLEKLAEE